MRLRSFASILALAIICGMPTAAAADRGWRHDANRVCEQLSVKLVPAYEAYIERVATQPEEAERRVARIDLLTSVSRASLAANKRLDRIDPPASVAKRYARMVRLDRLVNGRLPRRGAALLREPSSATNLAKIAKIDARGERLDMRLGRVARRIGLTDCG